MQISFLKDLATPRDPTSPFSFLNYLFSKGRLQKFINLGTFLPARREYEDYMRWCASHFSRAVRYGTEITRVDAVHNPDTGKVDRFNVHWTDLATGLPGSACARNVVVATGGSPAVPPLFAPFATGSDARFIHSSHYATAIPSLSPSLLAPASPKHFVVVGGGQSAAEIYVDLGVRFPEAKVTLLVKDSSLRPSDDSPFVNEIFDPDRVTPTYELGAAERAAKREKDKGTNYGVVRLELLERIYAELYAQEVDEPCEEKWRCRVRDSTTVVGVERLQGSSQSGGVRLEIAKTGKENAEREVLEVGLVVFATGYVRDAHVRILEGTRGLLAAEGGGAAAVAAPVEETAEEAPVEEAPVAETAPETTPEVVAPEPVEVQTTTETTVESTPAPPASLPAPGTITSVTAVAPAPETTTTTTTTETTTTETTETTPSPSSSAAAVTAPSAPSAAADATTTEEIKTTVSITSTPPIFPVGRDYKVQYAPGAVEEGAGVWLQGCNERTHGLSDTLLSILAHRGGEVVQSIFGPSGSK
ncbi:hypothetical protein V498_09391 [Pseudogymnoascus sp. VKM F-4517 (FW-2822)]|nr:hypothetical protein V498_09391 [Pseudogymnoascus sp. VKM F-4517 (FW-2822)]